MMNLLLDVLVCGIAVYYPTALRRVQITPETSTNITRYLYSICTSVTHSPLINIREIRPHGHNNLACWIINLLLDVLLCSIAEKFYSLFVF